MRPGKRHMTEGIELPKQEKLRMLREKETYKYLGILEADTLKLMEIKEKKLRKSISGKRGNYSKPNYIVEISSNQRDKRLGCPNCLILGGIFKVDGGGNQTNGQENKKTHDDT